jgi:hypothetical protein
VLSALACRFGHHVHLCPVVISSGVDFLNARPSWVMISPGATTRPAQVSMSRSEFRRKSAICAFVQELGIEIGTCSSPWDAPKPIPIANPSNNKREMPPISSQQWSPQSMRNQCFRVGAVTPRTCATAPNGSPHSVNNTSRKINGAIWPTSQLLGRSWLISPIWLCSNGEAHRL